MKPDLTSWDEDHEAFKKQVLNHPPGDRWKYGIYEYLPEDGPLITRIKDNSFYEFLVPEEHLSLKLFFDNFRNYGIAAAFAALGAWLWLSNGRATTLIEIPHWLLPSLAIATWALVACLLLLNIAQTWFLSRELILSIRAMQVRTRRYRFAGPYSFMVAFGHMCITLLIDFVVLIAIRLCAIALIGLCIGLVVYAVLASPALRHAA